MSASIAMRSWAAVTLIPPQMAGLFSLVPHRRFCLAISRTELVPSDAVRAHDAATDGVLAAGLRLAQHVSLRLRASPIWDAILTWPKTTPPQAFGGEHYLPKEAYNMARKSRRAEVPGAGVPLADENPAIETKEETVETKEETVPAAEASLPAPEDSFHAAEENSALVAAEEIQVEPSVPSVINAAGVKEDESPVDPVTGVIEAALADDFEVLEELGDESLRAAQSLATSYSENARLFAREAANYSRSCFEARASFAGAVLTAKSFENAVQLRNCYAKSAYARFMAHLLNMNALACRQLGEAFLQDAPPVTKVPGVKT
ncbi:phasin family protein [Methylocapsa sp. D3K7]|uniref:phasin family protein n=1 Tax=Methylocapsa sp. D3K7 TaxID=3041435 RepID=UPI00244EC905|nr:phasin family protein [Methylocapsa sp. D3K7]WGJ15445.1 phasin family protein [Methylocapsa sp. D3K7]